MSNPRKPTIYDRTDGTVLDEMTRREFKAAWDGPTPTVIESRTYAAGDYPDPETSRLAERAEPMVMATSTTREGYTTPRDADKPAGRWTVSHPDPATKARLEAEMNATGGCFTAPDEVGSFSIGYTMPAHDPALTVSLAPQESEPVDLSTLSNEDIDRLYGKGSWAAENMKWAKARPLGEVVAFGVTGERMGAERREPAKPTGNPAPAAGQVWVPELNSARRYTLTREVTRIPERWDTEEGVQILATTLVNQCRYVGTKADCWARAADAMQGAKVTAIHRASLAESYIVGPLDGPRTWTLTAPPADLRSLHDAIGQAIETGAARIEDYRGGPVVVTRDEMLFSPTVTMDASGGLPATVTIAADSKHLRMLRKVVDDARETGCGVAVEWGKGRRVEVQRVDEAPTVAEAPSEAEPVRYDGGQGGAQAWRWEVGE